MRRGLAADLAPLARRDPLGAIMRLAEAPGGGLELVVGLAIGDDRLCPVAQGVRPQHPRQPPELQTEIELLRSLIYRAAEAMIAGAEMTQLATMAKLKAGQLGRELPSACLQYWGGMGYERDAVSRAFRDGRFAFIVGDAEEVMLTILCKGRGQ